MRQVVELEFVDAMACSGQRCLDAAGVNLHGQQRALRRQQFGREMLAIALGALANGAKLVQLMIDDGHLPLEFVARFGMPAIDASGIEFDQRKRRGLDVPLREIEVALVRKHRLLRRPSTREPGGSGARYSLT